MLQNNKLIRNMKWKKQKFFSIKLMMKIVVLMKRKNKKCKVSRKVMIMFYYFSVSTENLNKIP